MEKNINNEISQNPKNGFFSKIIQKINSIPKRKLQILLGITIFAIVLSVALLNIMAGTSKKGHGAAGDINLDDLLNEGEVNKQEIINCLKDKGVSFYGSASCGFSKNDVQKYGKDMKNFPVVDCDEEKTLCDIAGITQCPAWSDGSKTEYDIKSIDELGTAFYCK